MVHLRNDSNDSSVADIQTEGKELPKTHSAVTGNGSLLSHYQKLVVGSSSLLYTFYYEWCTLLSHIPGALGIFLRKVFWPRLFSSCGKGVFFGMNVILRHPNRIYIGNHVVISDNCTLDARNPSSSNVIVLEDDCILSNDVRISCKNGSAKIGAHVGIGAQTIIHSGEGEPVSIGTDVIIGPRCYITGGGNYNSDCLDIPIRLQGRKIMGGSRLENGVWLGANVTILGNVTMGNGSIAGAGSVVTKTIPAQAICTGIPARVVRMRGSGNRTDNANK